MSYDNYLPLSSESIWLKGHQIIGELRPSCSIHAVLADIEGSPDHWWVTTCVPYIPKLWFNWRVTRSLVSYDKFKKAWCSSSVNWRVTRSLVSYDIKGIPMDSLFKIEGSPDHWWVTTKLTSYLQSPYRLKGHQIIGELRLTLLNEFFELVPLKGHQIIGELRRLPLKSLWLHLIEGSPDHWWVTTSIWLINFLPAALKGHQIIGELRPEIPLILLGAFHWRVTRSLVSYDYRVHVFII